MKIFYRFFYTVLVLTLFGCASTDKADPVSADELQLAVAEVEGLQKAADVDQAELLSYKEYVKGTDYLDKAQRGLAGSYESEYILKNAARGKSLLQQALANTRERTINAVRILEARKASLDAGLKNSTSLSEHLAEVDEDLRDETDNFARPLEPQEFSQFQKKYFSLEVRAVQFRELDDVRIAIEKASEDGARTLTPKTLRTALLDLSEAENLVAQSPRDPRGYEYVVNHARESSTFLSDVLNVILKATGTPEAIAVKIVEQNRKLAALSQNVGSLEKNLQSTQSTLQQTEASLKEKELSLEEKEASLQLKESELQKQNMELQSTKTSLQETESALLLQNQELEKTSTQVRFQKAMDEAMRQFSEDEATVYQQGSKLIFRLKRISFPSGAATIPAASKPLLTKVNDIIKNLGAEMVAVQGHTDSVGAAKLNKDLSTRRAISVANFLASLAGGYKIGYIGYGESKPIASNETREGRAINRRVDLVVTAAK